MSRNSKEQAQAQAQAQAMLSEAVTTEIKSMSAIDLMLKAVPDLKAKDSDGNEVLIPVTVGQKILTDETMRSVTVTARTIEKFSKVSNTALSVELGQVNKELAKKEGFTSVKRYASLVLPDLSDSRIMELYTVGRFFGDPTTHKWKAPIPEQASITNLSTVAKAFCNTKKLDEATDRDIADRFALFVRDYIETDRLDLTATLSDLREQIKDIKNPTIEGQATLITSEGQGEGQGEGQPEGQPEKVTGEVVTDREQAQKAFDILFAFFRGNDEAVDALTTALALMPKEQEQPEEEQPEA